MKIERSEKIVSSCCEEDNKKGGTFSHLNLMCKKIIDSGGMRDPEFDSTRRTQARQQGFPARRKQEDHPGRPHKMDFSSKNKY